MISQRTTQLPVWGGDTQRLPEPVVAASEPQPSQLALGQHKKRIGARYKQAALLVAGALAWPVVSNVVYWVGVLIVALGGVR